MAWPPVSKLSEPAATAILESLFQRHGSPLVLKSDNGSAFLGDRYRLANRLRQATPELIELQDRLAILAARGELLFVETSISSLRSNLGLI